MFFREIQKLLKEPGSVDLNVLILNYIFWHFCIFDHPDPGIKAQPHPDDLRSFDVTIEGSAGTCYEGGIFKLELFLPENYPHSPPKCRFLTKILFVILNSCFITPNLLIFKQK